MNQKWIFISIQALKVVIFLGFAGYFFMYRPEVSLPNEAYKVFAGFLVLYSIVLLVRIFQRLKQD
jgi:hypothetical protein